MRESELRDTVVGKHSAVRANSPYSQTFQNEAANTNKPARAIFMGKAHKNCIIGQKFCLHHITGTAFIIRLKVYAYIVDNSDTFQKIYSFMHFK